MACRPHAPDHNDLMTAMSILQCTIFTAQQLSEMHDTLQAMDLAEQGNRGLTFDVSQLLKANTGFHLATNAMELILVSKLFSVVENVHKGDTHPIANSIRTQWLPALNLTIPKIMELSREDPLIPAKILLSFHYEWYEWHVEAARLPPPDPGTPIQIIPPPNFADILKNVRTGRWMPPSIPWRYLGTSSGGATPRGGGGSGGGGGGGGGGRSSSELGAWYPIAEGECEPRLEVPTAPKSESAK